MSLKYAYNSRWARNNCIVYLILFPSLLKSHHIYCLYSGKCVTYCPLAFVTFHACHIKFETHKILTINLLTWLEIWHNDKRTTPATNRSTFLEGENVLLPSRVNISLRVWNLCICLSTLPPPVALENEQNTLVARRTLVICQKWQKQKKPRTDNFLNVYRVFDALLFPLTIRRCCGRLPFPLSSICMENLSNNAGVNEDERMTKTSSGCLMRNGMEEESHRVECQSVRSKVVGRRDINVYKKKNEFQKRN